MARKKNKEFAAFTGEEQQEQEHYEARTQQESSPKGESEVFDDDEEHCGPYSQTLRSLSASV